MYATRYVPVNREIRPATVTKMVFNSELVVSIGFVALQLLAVAVIGFLVQTGPSTWGPLP